MHEAEAGCPLLGARRADGPLPGGPGRVADVPPDALQGRGGAGRACQGRGRPEAQHRSRISVLLANRACDQTLTVTPTLWAMLGVLPMDDIQAPHRHQSVALDLIIDCKPGCFTLVGKELDDSGRIIDPPRVD